MVFLYRVGREKEFRIKEFAKIAPVVVIETHVGKFGRRVFKYV